MRFLASVINVHSLYAITGVPTSVRHLTIPGYHACFAHVALRRVRSCAVVLHQPATLCKGWTYYSCSPLVVMNTGTIHQPYTLVLFRCGNAGRYTGPMH